MTTPIANNSLFMANVNEDFFIRSYKVYTTAMFSLFQNEHINLWFCA